MKPDLVLIHSFPTNSKLLAGLIEYLDDFFTVHFIDLPGFVKTEAPLDTITIDAYAEYVQSRIDDLKLEAYYIGGISFGFIIILRLKLSDHCRGILAIEPFVGTPGLQVKKSWKFVYIPIISLVIKYDLGRKLWNSQVFRFAFKKFFLGDRPIAITHTILDEIDGKAFFETFKIILSTPLHEKLHNTIPHVLFINHQDKTLNSVYVESIFREKIPKLLVIENTLPHFPDDLSKEFFESELHPDLISKTVSFLKTNQSPKKEGEKI